MLRRKGSIAMQHLAAFLGRGPVTTWECWKIVDLSPRNSGNMQKTMGNSWENMATYGTVMENDENDGKILETYVSLQGIEG